MQAKEQKISPIKQRILQFAETLHISKRDFYTIIGVSRGTLEANSGITEDVLAKFIATYPKISLEWLILGQGSMLRSGGDAPATQDADKSAVETYLKGEIKEKDAEIARLNQRIGALEEQQKGSSASFRDYLPPCGIDALPIDMPALPDVPTPPTGVVQDALKNHRPTRK